MFEDAEHPSEQQAQQGQHHGSSLIDFFISYRGSDRGWAEWIAWQLERAGYTISSLNPNFGISTVPLNPGQSIMLSVATHPSSPPVSLPALEASEASNLYV